MKKVDEIIDSIAALKMQNYIEAENEMFFNQSLNMKNEFGRKPDCAAKKDRGDNAPDEKEQEMRKLPEKPTDEKELEIRKHESGDRETRR